MDHDDAERDSDFSGYDHDDHDEWEDDTYFGCGCDTPECIVPGPHYRSECETVADAEAYYDSMEHEDDPASQLL